jgi:hypothetical protein
MERKQKAMHSEKSADQEVINSLLNTLRIYNDMENFIVNEAGKLVKVSQFEVLALDEAKKIAEALQTKLTLLQNWITAEEVKVSQPAAEEKPVVEPPAPADVTPPADPASDTPAAPAEPAAPASDPAPATDPNETPAAPADPTASDSTAAPADDTASDLTLQ